MPNPPDTDRDRHTQTVEQARRHYLVEKELAARLRASTREERSVLFGKLYQELFDRVPDHPRLVRRDTPEFSRRSIAARLRLLTPYLSAEKTFLEFAPGDCRLLREAARSVRRAIGVDISDQRGEETAPEGFELVVYDGYQLDLPSEVADVLFSFQFLEHLHPDDVDLHFALAYRLLRPGGVYVFATPHVLSGPHDVSRFFSDTPECFHLKEWTYREMREVLSRAGFRSSCTYRFGQPRPSWIVTAGTLAIERLLGWIPSRKWQRKLSRRIFESVTMVAFK